MPLTRYQIRNEYSLADSELYRAADKDDPEALLEGVAMAGLVGVLRQLGDLAEFAAEIFHDLHEEVMTTAARGHGLSVRVQQLEAEFPSIEKALLCQTNHSSFFHNTGIDWHPNLPMDQNLIAQGDLPRFVMDSYEECRGPPQLFLLDKFDVAGTGSCLKRYTDPSFFKIDPPPPLLMNTEVQRETKTRKAKKKGSRWRNGETPEVLPTSHTKLHQLFLEESVENHISNPACRVKLKRRLNGFPYDSRTGKSYMEKLFQISTPGHNVVYEISGDSSPLKLPSNLTGEPGSEILEISMVSPGEESMQRKGSPCSSPDFDETEGKPSTNMLTEEEVDFGISEVSKQNNMSEADVCLSSTLHEEENEEEIMVDQERKIQVSTDSYQSDDIASEVESYMDALATMDSEMETDTEGKTKDGQHLLKTKNQGIDSEANEEQHEFYAQFSDSHSIGNSTATDDGNSLSRKGISISSYSDSVSNLAEITPSNGHVSANFLPSSEIYVAEVVNMSSDQCSVNGGSLSFKPIEHITGDAVCIKEAKIPNYRPGCGEPSSHSYFTDLTPIILPVDEGQSSIEGASGEPQLDEILLNLNEHNVRLGNNEEDSMNVGDNVNLSEVIPQAGDDFVPQVSAEDEIDKQQPQVLSHVSLQLPGILKLAPEKKSSENLFNNLPEAEYAEDELRKKLVSQIGSSLSVASCTEEQPVISDLPEVEVPPSSSPGLGEPSSRTCLAGSAPMLLPVDVGNKSKEGAYMGAELDEVSSNNNEPNAGNNNPEEDGMHVDDGFPRISNLSDDLCQTRDGFIHYLSAEKHPAGELGEKEPYILHDASLHCPHIIEQAPEKKGSENLLDNVLEAEFAEDDCSQVSFDNQIDSSCLVALSTEKQLLCSALPELETCDSNVKPNNTVSEVDNTLPLSGELAISSSPVLDSPQGNNFTKQEFLEVTEHVTSLEPDSTEPVSSYSKEKNLYGALIEADGEVLCGFSSDMDLVRKEVSDLQFPSDVQNCPDPSPVQKPCVQLDNIAANNVQSEDMIMATAVANTSYDDNEDNGKGESSNAIKLQEESISILQDLLDETDLPGHLQATGTEKEEDQHTVASSDLNSVRSDNVPYNCSNLELLDSIPDLSMAGISQDNLHIVNAGELLLCSDLNDQDSESNTWQSNVVASAEDDVGSPSNQVAERLTLEGKAALPVGQLDLENLHATQGNSEPFFEVEQMQFSNHLDQEHTDASSDISAVHVQSQPSVSGFEQQLAVSDQTKDLSSPLLPSLGLLSEASQISLDEMPPLPPLPPAQWRKGKVLCPALVPENNLIQHNLDPFPQILISTAEEKSQFSHLAMEGESTQYSNPFLPLSTVNDEHFQFVNESVAGYMVHSPPLSLQASNTTNDRNIEDDFPSSSGIQSVNACAVLPTTVNDERSEQGYLVLEQGTEKPTLDPFSPKTNEAIVSTCCPMSSPEILIQPVHQSVKQIISEDNHWGTSVTSEGKIMSPPDTTFPPQIMQDNKPHHDFATSEGQITGPSNTSILLAPSDEGKPNGNRQPKLPRPRNPLIDAVIAHDKSKLRKVTERVRPQIEQKPDERDSLLEQIRTKSFNLKPAVGTRPSIQAPKTNLKVAAILEKANAIRQALAGSDEEDDEEGWSDS
ncbi:protein SCAR2 [Diospyros lotus]|uniref:protein SCAR2 n=1 Tax=Diospyros lotus TaxID=55363 RepID=UPI00224DD66C|nr:protein SCAR2 [Diospyros lotus]